MVGMGRGERIALGGAFCWSVLLLIGAYVLPVYQGEVSTQRSNGRVHSRETSATLVEMHGSGALIAVAVPLAATLLVTLALLAQDPGQNAGPLAWTLVILLGGFNVLALLTIGIFLLPTTICLLVACGLHNADLERAQSG
jgi:hypothetical protein